MPAVCDKGRPAASALARLQHIEKNPWSSLLRSVPLTEPTPPEHFDPMFVDKFNSNRDPLEHLCQPTEAEAERFTVPCSCSSCHVRHLPPHGPAPPKSPAPDSQVSRHCNSHDLPPARAPETVRDAQGHAAARRA